MMDRSLKLMPFDQIAYIAEYDKANTQRVALKLNKTHDADIIKHLEAQGNKQGYIKALIRADIKKNER